MDYHKALRPAYIVVMDFKSGVKGKLIFIPALQTFGFKVNNEQGQGWIDFVMNFESTDLDAVEAINVLIGVPNLLIMLGKIEEMQTADIKAFEQRLKFEKDMHTRNKRLDDIARAMGLLPKKPGEGNG